VNGKKLSDPTSLQLMVAQTAPGTKVTLRILRSEAGKKPVEKTLSTTLAELPQEAFANFGGRGSGSSHRGQSSHDALDGVELGNLDSQTRHQADIPNSVKGALVTGVDQDSNAAAAGLRPGDVIVEIDRQPVRNAQEANSLTQKAK